MNDLLVALRFIVAAERSCTGWAVEDEVAERLHEAGWLEPVATRPGRFGSVRVTRWRVTARLRRVARC